MQSQKIDGNVKVTTYCSDSEENLFKTEMVLIYNKDEYEYQTEKNFIEAVENWSILKYMTQIVSTEKIDNFGKFEKIMFEFVGCSPQWCEPNVAYFLLPSTIREKKVCK